MNVRRAMIVWINHHAQPIKSEDCRHYFILTQNLVAQVMEKTDGSLLGIDAQARINSLHSRAEVAELADAPS